MWDWRQVNDTNDWMASVGVEFPFDAYVDDWNFATWLNFGSNQNSSESIVVEVSYTFD
ncbi:MAG TPA: hypothetical protein VGB30_14105 [bacterium]|jgi:hypothetical protein